MLKRCAEALALLGLSSGLGELAWALGRFEADYAWPLLSRPQAWACGVLAGLAWAAACQAWWGRLHGLGARKAWRIALFSLLPWALAWAWPLAAARHLPPPHQGPWRGVQFLAALCAVATVLLALAWGWRLWWASGQAQRLSAWARALRLAGSAWAAFLLIGTWSFSWHATGDYPHYLIMAHSLAYDGDLDLKDDYAQGEWRRWQTRPLAPQYPEHQGHAYTEHKAGVAAVLVPAYRCLGVSGALWTVTLLGALAVGLLALWLHALRFSGAEQVLGAFLLSANAAWLVHSNHVLPELPLGLLLTVLLAVLARALPRPFWALGLAGLAWVSVRAYPLAAALWCWRAWTRRQERDAALAWDLGIPALSFGLALALNRAEFGSWDPSAAYASHQLGLGQLFQPAALLQHLGGLLLDQEFGYLTYMPLALLALPGLLAWWRSGSAPKAELVIIAVCYLAVVAQYFEWHGSMGPARYLVCLSPLLVLAVLWARRSGLGGALFNGLALLQVGLGWALAALPLLSYSDFSGGNRFLRLLLGSSGAFLTRILPSFIVLRPISYAWLALFAAVSYGLIRLLEPRPSAAAGWQPGPVQPQRREPR